MNVQAHIQRASQGPWIDGEVLHFAHIKERIRKKALNSNNPLHWEEYKKANTYVRNISRKKHQNCINNYFENVDKVPKNFWKFVKIHTNKSSYPVEMSYNGKVSSNSKGKVDLFNEHFFQIIQ